MRKRLPYLAMIILLLLTLPAASAAARHPAPYLWLPAALPVLAATLDGPYIWPVDGPVVGPFDPPPKPWLPGHRGVDLQAPAGSPVRAVTGGVVRFAGRVAGRPLLSIDHPNGTRTTYEPVQPLMAAGEAVAAGDLIGTLLAGHRGCASPCLHWGLRRGDTYLDPLSLLGLGRVRLLPAQTPAPRLTGP